MSLGQRICLYRTRRGMSQLELAERLEVSRQSISKWETDASVPELEKLVNLCEVFEVTLDELVNKPMRDMETVGYATDGNRVCGVLDLEEEGVIRLPRPVMELFDIKAGEKILLLADKKQGIAIVKCTQF